MDPNPEDPQLSPVVEEPAVSPVVEEIPVVEEPTITPVVEEIPVVEEPAIAPVVEEIPVVEEPTITPIVQNIPANTLVLDTPIEKNFKLLGFRVTAITVQLGEYAQLSILLNCIRGDEPYMEYKVLLLEGEDYLAWGSDDKYIIDFVQSKLSNLF